MLNRHTLGRINVKAGEILTFTYKDRTPRHVTVVALHDIDLSKELAEFCGQLDRRSRSIFTENVLPAFIEHLTDKRLLHVGNEVSVDMGVVGRPSKRLLEEYKFSINPEMFWEDKVIHRYTTSSFSVINHQEHLLTLLMDVDAPFTVVANLIDIKGDTLGVIRLVMLSDHRHTLINEEDNERIRMALQSDLSLTLPEINVLVATVEITPNPEYGNNPFKLIVDKEKRKDNEFAEPTAHHDQ
jgi:hypothetical protein